MTDRPTFALRRAGAAMLTAAALAAGPAQAQMAVYTLDREHAVVAFLIDHIGYAATLGRFTGMEGTIEFDADALELGSVDITVDPATVFTDNDARDNHVRGGDFLDVEAHPAIRFTADGGEAQSEDTGTVTGTLEILGQRNPLTLDVTLNKIAEYPFGHQRQTVGISARGTLMRSDFGMTYGVENGLVGDEVELIIEAEFVRAE